MVFAFINKLFFFKSKDYATDICKCPIKPKIFPMWPFTVKFATATLGHGRFV